MMKIKQVEPFNADLLLKFLALLKIFIGLTHRERFVIS
jgi:hypothetical protein